MKQSSDRHCGEKLQTSYSFSSLRANAVSVAIQSHNGISGWAGLLRRLRLLAMTATLLPAAAISCIITDNPCQCTERCMLYCMEFGPEWFLAFFTSIYAVFSLYMLIPMVGIYWSVQNKTSRKTALWIAAKITLLFALALFGLRELMFFSYAIVFWTCLNILFLWIWRKELNLWRAIPVMLICMWKFSFYATFLLTMGIDYLWPPCHY